MLLDENEISTTEGLSLGEKKEVNPKTALASI